MKSNATSARFRGLSPGSVGVPPVSGGHRQIKPTADSAGVPPVPVGWHSRGYLPHLDHAGRVQALTFRLSDIMPNHVHVLIETIVGHSIGEIVHSWKSFTGLWVNTLLGEAGRFWAADYHDRYIRDENYLLDAIAYIELNPVRAGLCGRVQDWLGSQAGMAWKAPDTVTFARSGQDARAPGAEAPEPDGYGCGRDARAPGVPRERFTC